MSTDAVQQRIDQLWDFGDPSASEARFKSALSEFQSAADRLQLQTQVARAQGLQRRFDEGHRTLDDVQVALDDSAQGSDSNVARELAIARVRLLLERGRLFNSSGQRDAASPLFQQAFKEAQRVGNDHLAIDAAHMVAIVLDAQGDGSNALAWNNRALEVANKSSQPRARQWRASLHNNMGWTLHGSGEFESALSHFEAALAARREQGDGREIRIATWCVARCLRSLGRVGEALRLQQSIADDSRACGQEPDGFNEEELAECLLELGQPLEAAVHFRRAFDLLSRDLWLVDREPQRLDRLKRMAGGAMDE